MKNRKNVISFITKVAIFTAISYLLYYVKFPVFFFPSYLEIQFSNIPALLGGFVLGPFGGSLIVIIRFFFKLLTTKSLGIGEFVDLLIGLSVVLSSSIVYKKHKSKKGGFVSLVIALIMWCISGCLTNTFISLPFYIDKFFGGVDAFVASTSSYVSFINMDNYMVVTIFAIILPFNLMLGSIITFITFIVYKRISTLFKKDLFDSSKKALVLCDSFKGTLTSIEVNQIIKEELNKKNYIVKTFPISDGGEGFLDAMKIVDKKTKKYYLDTFDAIGRNIQAPFLYNKINKIAYFSLGDTVGLSMLKDGERDCYKANTFGLGFLMKQVILKYNVKQIVLGIGGSASTDAGCGMLEAMGVKFYDKDGSIINSLNGENLSNISCVITNEFEELIKNIHFLTLSDVTNPLCGENGSAYVYGPQKGASEKDVKILDNNLRNFSNICNIEFNKDYSIESGSGAAGGVGFACLAFLHAELVSGIDYILDTIRFDDLLKRYDLVISGEGKIDNQSFQGKVISGIIKHNPKDLRLVVGLNKSDNSTYPIYSIVPSIATAEESMNNPYECLKELVKKEF